MSEGLLILSPRVTLDGHEGEVLLELVGWAFCWRAWVCCFSLHCSVVFQEAVNSGKAKSNRTKLFVSKYSSWCLTQPLSMRGGL